MVRWETHDVKFDGGNLRRCLARLDYAQKWIASDVNTSARTFRDFIRKLAHRADAKIIEIKYMYHDEMQAEKDEDLLCLSFYRTERSGYDFSRILKSYGT